MLSVPSHPDAFEAMCLQAADCGRGEILFGECLPRARTALRPFMVGEGFPSVYLEFPLAGAPFLDVTVLYDKLEPGTRIASTAAAGTEALLDWYAKENPNGKGDLDVSFGFELDVKDPALPRAAVHFQPRRALGLVEPFCEAAGEPERARLYLDLAARMPAGWPLSFFGMFRGRPGSPLRVCGYLAASEKRACAKDPGRIAGVFDELGFTAYDETMVSRISTLMGATEETVDFQFDVYDDGHLGPTFAVDLQFGIERPEAVGASFRSGPASRVLGLLESWGAADGRWRLGGDAAFARALDVALEDGGTGRYAFTLMPQWAKARWTGGELQPSKLYLLARSQLLETAGTAG